MQIDLVILNFLTYEDTYENIKSLVYATNYRETDLEIIIVDNLSNEKKLNSLKFKLDKFNLNIRYVVSSKNLGFANGMNLGIKHSRKQFVICSNNDILYEKFDFKNFLSPYFNDSKIAVIGPSIKNLNNKYQNPYITDDVDWNLLKRKIKNYLFFGSSFGYIFYYFWSLKNEILNKNNTSKNIKTDSQYVYALHGAYFMLTPTYFKYYQGLDENTFLFSEELILAERVKSKLLKEFYYSEEEVIHKEDSATNILLNKRLKKLNFILKENYKSRKYFFEEYIWKK